MAKTKAANEAPIQAQGIHHITLNGADRQTSIDFWQGVLGMPLVFEQPNLDSPELNHLFFDSGDSRLLTVFTSENTAIDKKPNPNNPGNVHHLAFNISLATYTQATAKLKQFGIATSGEIDRGFMHSIYFRDPLGQLIELACYKFQPPTGYTNSDVLRASHDIRVAAGDGNIEDKHIAQALAELSK